jgi:hypothetical protein
MPRRKSFKRNIEKINKKELEEYGVITKFEFGILIVLPQT